MKFDLKKATRELLLIVIGVLIAFWVEGWREDRADRQTEQAYLRSLLTDLDADLAEIDSATLWSTRFEAAVGTVYGFLNGDSISIDSLAVMVALAGWQYPPAFSTHTIDDLRSTGNLRLLRVETVKRSISAYYQDVGRYARLRQPLIDRVWNGYDARVRAVLSPAQRLQAVERFYGPQVPSDPETLRRWSDAGHSDIRAAFQEDPSLVDALNDVLYAAVEHRGYLASLRGSTERTRDIVQSHVRR